MRTHLSCICYSTTYTHDFIGWWVTATNSLRLRFLLDVVSWIFHKNSTDSSWTPSLRESLLVGVSSSSRHCVQWTVSHILFVLLFTENRYSFWPLQIDHCCIYHWISSGIQITFTGRFVSCWLPSFLRTRLTLLVCLFSLEALSCNRSHMHLVT